MKNANISSEFLDSWFRRRFWDMAAFESNDSINMSELIERWSNTNGIHIESVKVESSDELASALKNGCPKRSLKSQIQMRRIILGISDALRDAVRIGNVDELVDLVLHAFYDSSSFGKSGWIMDATGLRQFVAEYDLENPMGLLEIADRSKDFSIPENMQIKSPQNAHKHEEQLSNRTPNVREGQNLSFRLRRNNVDFRIEFGDLFDVAAEIIVNSEQSDFVLASNRQTISGRIWHDGGQNIQKELNDQTKGADQSVGTVLETGVGRLDPSIRGRGHLKRIYHAALHGGFGKQDTMEQSEGTELEVVETCLREILRRFDASGYGSIAIPLLGTGIYGLDARIVAATIARDIHRYAHRASTTQPRQILLVLNSDERGWSAMQSATQALIDLASTPSPWDPIQVGIPLLDRFEHIIASAQDPMWRAMQMCRYAELLSHHLLAVAASTVEGQLLDKINDQNIIGPHSGAFTFGHVSKLLEQAINSSQTSGQPDWKIETIRFASEKRKKLDKFRFWRNDLAHGRLAKIQLSNTETLLRDLLNFQSWRAITEVVPHYSLAELSPWIIADEKDGIFRIVEQISWNDGKINISYLDPVESSVISRSLHEL